MSNSTNSSSLREALSTGDIDKVRELNAQARATTSDGALPHVEQHTQVHIERPFYDPMRGEKVEIAICPMCGAWLPWNTIEAIGGIEHRHNAQYVEFVKREAVIQ